MHVCHSHMGGLRKHICHVCSGVCVQVRVQVRVQVIRFPGEVGSAARLCVMEKLNFILLGLFLSWCYRTQSVQLLQNKSYI